MKRENKIVIRFCRSFRSCEVSEMNSLSVFVRPRTITTISSVIDSLEPGFAISLDGNVRAILNCIRNSEVAPTIIKSVTVLMVGSSYIAIWKTNDEAMQPDSFVLSRVAVSSGSPAIRIGSPAMRGLRCGLPVKRDGLRIVTLINDSKKSLGEWDAHTLDSINENGVANSTANMGTSVALNKSARLTLDGPILLVSVIGNGCGLTATTVAKSVRNVH